MANDTRKRQLGKLIYEKRKKMKMEKITKTSKTETLTSGNNNMGGDHEVWYGVEGRAHSDRHILQETPGTQFPVISGQHCHWQR